MNDLALGTHAHKYAAVVATWRDGGGVHEYIFAALLFVGTIVRGPELPVTSAHPCRVASCPYLIDPRMICVAFETSPVVHWTA